VASRADVRAEVNGHGMPRSGSSQRHPSCRNVDARSDIFSFGALLYEMLTGRRAFSGDSKMSTLAAIINLEPEQLEKQVQGFRGS